LGCSGALGGNAKSPAELARRNTEVVHESCDVASGGSEKLDANADGRPDVTIVRDDGRELCRAVDLNFDGKVDTWVYRDGSGKVRRREMDYDRDGKVEEIQIYRGGVISEKQRATALASKLDTWHFYTSGQLARTERDSDGDAIVDQWWEYAKPGCPMIHSDLNGDGRPDPTATVDYCKQTGYVPPERMGDRAPTSPTFQAPGALPTELENKPQGTEGGEQGSAPGAGGTGTGTGAGTGAGAGTGTGAGAGTSTGGATGSGAGTAPQGGSGAGTTSGSSKPPGAAPAGGSKGR
jgi:hypothetical protein